MTARALSRCTRRRAFRLTVDAVSGSDAAGDGTPGAPWQTISHALSRVHNEGSEIAWRRVSMTGL